MQEFDYQSHTRAIFGSGSFERLGQLSGELGFQRTLLVADRGLVAAGYVDQAARLLRGAEIEVVPFHDFEVNPDTEMIEKGCAQLAPLKIDSIVGLGGGSSMDCAKGLNFLLSNGGRMQDYRGYAKASKPMLPMIAVPTTAGTGSEAQSYAVISDARAHVKIACGDPKAAFRVAILDPSLTLSQPSAITATAGFDAIAHAVETYVTTERNPLSDVFSREAWRLLEANYESVLADPDDLAGRTAMQLGAYFAGVAIESSMLGATHACANPLTMRYGTTHGAALAMLLPTVVRWNSSVAADRYAELARLSNLYSGSDDPEATETLARRLAQLAAAGELDQNLSAAGVRRDELPVLAADASRQWTGQFNPRPFDATGALEVYESAY